MTQIDTPRGPIIALKDDGLVYARGIQFATAERYKRPVPATWTEPRDCTKKNTICPQHQFRFEFVIGPMPLDRPMGEDCLRLSVIAPEKPTGEVLVWFHGGANISGGADIDVMDTSGFAKMGIVTVAVQYRLGLFGCVEMPGVEANLHVYDQIESLKWVQECIGAFGGDPSKVTIMGQSAGGWGIYNMMCCARGLFKRACIISSPLGMQPNGKLGKLVRPIETVEEIMAEQERLLKLKEGSIDDYIADRKKAPFPKDLDAEVAKCELLIGWAADDCLPFIRLIPAGRYVTSWVPSAEYWIGKAATVLLFKRPSERVAKIANATTFEWQWFPEGNPFRACHCIEMPFMFNGWARWAAAPLLKGAEEKEVAQMAVEVKKFFVQYIRHGLPKKHIEIKKSFSEKDWSKA